MRPMESTLGTSGSHDAAQPRGDAQVLLQAVEAAAASGEEGEDAGEGCGGGDLRRRCRASVSWPSWLPSPKTFST